MNKKRDTKMSVCPWDEVRSWDEAPFFSLARFQELDFIVHSEIEYCTRQVEEVLARERLLAEERTIFSLLPKELLFYLCDFVFLADLEKLASSSRELRSQVTQYIDEKTLFIKGSASALDSTALPCHRMSRYRRLVLRKTYNITPDFFDQVPPSIEEIYLKAFYLLEKVLDLTKLNSLQRVYLDFLSPENKVSLPKNGRLYLLSG